MKRKRRKPLLTIREQAGGGKCHGYKLYPKETLVISLPGEVAITVTNDGIRPVFLKG